jgi:hypothetical protein
MLAKFDLELIDNFIHLTDKIQGRVIPTELDKLERYKSQLLKLRDDHTHLKELYVLDYKVLEFYSEMQLKYDITTQI